jgi:putative methylase
MKQRQLEMILEKIPKPTAPIPHLEQYMTPAPIAADVIFTAYQWGDIQDKTIVDLGCGTGRLAVGAYLMGAKKVQGFDLDPQVIKEAQENAIRNNYSIDFKVHDIKEVQTNCDTVLMNPPFGAQKANLHADRKFIEKGFEISSVIYSFHLKKTIPFSEKMISALNGEITLLKDYEFPIKWMFDFHYKQIVSYKVALLRINTNK